MDWIKKIVLGLAKKIVHKKIEKLDEYQDELEGIISTYNTAGDIVDGTIDKIQEKLNSIIDKAFGFVMKFLGGELLNLIVAQLKDKVATLDESKEDIIAVIPGSLDPKETAKLIINKVKEILKQIADDVIDAAIEELFKKEEKK